MLTLARTEVAQGISPNMTCAELDSELCEAKRCFEQALAQKNEIDRIYLAAANKLNMLERVKKKVEQRAAADKRAADKFLVRVA